MPKKIRTYYLESMSDMTRLTKLIELLYFKGIIIEKKIKLYEENGRNVDSDFNIIISMKVGE